MDERAKGLLLRVHPLSETSVIVRWITLEHGKISTVAKGARRPKSPFTGKLDLFFLCEFSFTRSRKSDLHNLREVALLESWPELRRDLSVLRRVSYAAALIEQTTESDSPVPELFDLLLGFLDYQRAAPAESGEKNDAGAAQQESRRVDSSPTSLPLLSFEVKLLRLLGLDPVEQEAKLSPGAKQLLKHLGGADWQALSRLRLSVGQFAELNQFLYGFMVFHLGKVPRGRKSVEAR
jgi:hypothetical protein